MAKIDKFQKKLVKKLRTSEVYMDADVYTILLDLSIDQGVDDVFMMLHNVATEMGKRKLLESLYKKSETWKW